MATQAEIEALLTAIATTNQATTDLDDARRKLQSYRNTRQEYATLVDQQKVVVDGLVASSETALRDLAAKINTVFPPGP